LLKFCLTVAFSFHSGHFFKEQCNIFTRMHKAHITYLHMTRTQESVPVVTVLKAEKGQKAACLQRQPQNNSHKYIHSY
jgi:hypothetical protein